MEHTIKVFCYGSNMSSKRLKARCPGAVFSYVAELSQYSFSFNKKSTQGIGSGKGNIKYTGIPLDIVWGVIFEIPKDEEPALDEAEGFNIGHYLKVKLIVISEKQKIEVVAYIASDPEFIDNSEIPFDWYKNHCVKGAIEHNLPNDYIEFLKSFECKKDLNEQRSLENFGLYQSN
jgi:gamma-glutamylcyclotransferase